MKKWLSTCFAAICISSSLQAQLENETLKLWYDGPATQWVEALPLGNGRIRRHGLWRPCTRTIPIE